MHALSPGAGRGRTSLIAAVIRQLRQTTFPVRSGALAGCASVWILIAAPVFRVQSQPGVCCCANALMSVCVAVQPPFLRRRWESEALREYGASESGLLATSLLQAL